MGRLDLLLVFFVTAGRSSAEAILLLLAAGAVKAGFYSQSGLRKLGYAAAGLLLFLGLSLALFCMMASWHLFSKTESFLDANQIVASFASPRAMFFSNMLTIRSDQVRFFSALGGAFAAAAVTLLYVPQLQSLRHAARLLFSLFAAGLISILCHFFVPNYLMDDAHSFEFEKYVGYFSSPDIALVSSWIDSFGVPQLDQETKRALLPIISPQEYAAKASAKHPRSFIVLAVEALRADAVNSEVMPFVARLARDGAAFNKFFAQSSESNYSLFTIFSSLYPLKNTLRDTFAVIDYPLNRIYDLLSLEGFKTGFVLADGDQWHNLKKVLYSENLDMYEIARQRQRDAAVMDLIADFAAKAKAEDKSFFTGAFLVGSHFPYYQEYVARPIYTDVGISADEFRSLSFISYPPTLFSKMHRRYLNCLSAIDSLIGQLFSRLEGLGLLEHTVLLITGDHGELFGEHGLVSHAGALHREALQVPLIVWAKDLPALDSDGLYGHIDIAPSILDLAGLPPFENFQGRSFVFNGNQKRKPAPLFASIQSIAHQDAVISWPWLYVVDYKSGRDSVEPLAGDSSLPQSLRRCLQTLVKNYQRLQIGYYQGQEDVRAAFFPPKYAIDPCAGQ